jgi:hypothetical protein
MKSMNIKTLKLFKDAFFATCGVNDNGMRHRNIVIHRKAWGVVASKYATRETLGAVLGRNHSTITHYVKCHEAEMMNEDYREAYEMASILVNNFSPKTAAETLEEILRLNASLVREVSDLKAEVKQLYIYKVNYTKIFNTGKECSLKQPQYME